MDGLKYLLVHLQQSPRELRDIHPIVAFVEEVLWRPRKPSPFLAFSPGFPVQKGKKETQISR